MNWTKRNFLIIINALVIGFLFTGCEKEKDVPPLQSLDPNSIITLDSLIKIYQHYGQAVTFNDAFFADETKNPSGVTEYNIYALVTMSQESGNIYNQAYIQDETAAINVRFSRTNLLQGDSIRINLKGTTVSAYNSMMQLDSVDAYENVVQLKQGIDIQPEEVSITDILNGGYMAKFVKLVDVQFRETDIGSLFADPVGLNTINRTLEDCFGNSIVVRTSGYANFAGKQVPGGRGSLIAVVGLYRPSWQNFDTWQLYIRHFEEIEMDGARCGDVDGTLLFSEDFMQGTIGSPINFNGWKSIAIAGTKHWITSTTGSRNFAQITAYGSGEESNIAWLTTPAIAASSYQSSTVTFETAYLNFKHDGLKAFVSYNFDGTNPAAATWTELPAIIASSNVNQDTWVGSGEINVANTGRNFHIGFKYTGSGTEDQTTLYRLDKVKVYGIN